MVQTFSLSFARAEHYSATLDGVKANSSALIYPDGIQPNDRQTGIGSNEKQRIRNKGRLICTHTLCCGSSRAPDSSSEVWRKRSQNHSAYGVHGPLVGISIRFPVDEFLESSKCILHTIVQSSITVLCYHQRARHRPRLLVRGFSKLQLRTHTHHSHHSQAHTERQTSIPLPPGRTG